MLDAQVPADAAALKKRRVVITGLGLVSPLGQDADEFYDNLLEGVNGISQIEAFDCSAFPSVSFLLGLLLLLGWIVIWKLCFMKQRIAGEIKNLSTDGWVSPKQLKRADKFMLFLLIAGKKALANGGITDEVMTELDKLKCGVIIGSFLGSMKVIMNAYDIKNHGMLQVASLLHLLDMLHVNRLVLHWAYKPVWDVTSCISRF